MALGAQPGSVHRLILRQGLRPVLAGLAAGLLAWLVAMRALASLLYLRGRPADIPGGRRDSAVDIGARKRANMAAWQMLHAAS